MIADLHDLFEPVGNIYDGDSGCGKLSHNLEEDLDFLLAQRRGRLIHDQHLQVILHQISGNLDHLLLSDSKFSHLRIQVKRMLQPLKDLAGSIHMYLVIQDNLALGFLFVHIDVLVYIQVWEQAQFLVDDADSVLPCLCRILEEYFLIPDIHLAFIRLFDSGNHLHQGGFAGAILSDQHVNLPS